MANYPYETGPTYVDIIPAPETLNPRYDSPDPFTGGSSGPANVGRVKGAQPGFTSGGIPVVALDAATWDRIAGPQPG